MDRFGEWRQIEPASDDEPDRNPADAAKPATRGARDLRYVGVLAAAVMLVVGAYVWLTMPSVPSGVTIAGQVVPFDPASPVTGAQPTGSPGPVGDVVVDVQGAVAIPGVHRLAAGSRVGDAIAAAGGYSATIDIAAAARSLNLAERLVDGAKIQVPVRGAAGIVPSSSLVPSQPGAIVAEGSAGSLVNVNTASGEQLDTLPGIGPVTAAKIIAARETAPFATIEDLVSREVIGPATLEKLRDLVTVGQ